MMMVDKEDLGLSLSLSTSTPAHHDAAAGGIRNHSPSAFQLSLLSAPPAFSPFISPLHKSDSIMLPSSDRSSELVCRPTAAHARSSSLKGIDVNMIPVGVDDDDDDAGVSSPNSTISSVISGKRCERENNSSSSNRNHNHNSSNAAVSCDENDADRTSSRGGAGSDDDDGDTNSRKKLRLSKDQSAVLEETFKEHNTLNPKQKLALAKRLGLRPRQVEVWFQNRRARTKLKQTEVDCEFLKRCCEQLTEDNRRLQKEVQELRALKLSPQFYMHMTPPTTLTMCPSCERVGVPAAAALASSVPAHPADSRLGNPVGTIPASHRPVPVSDPWDAAPVTLNPFEVLRPRS